MVGKETWPQGISSATASIELESLDIRSYNDAGDANNFSRHAVLEC